MFERKVMASLQGMLSGAIDYNGINDFLRRDSSLAGAQASRTFTFSCWFYIPDDGTEGTLFSMDFGPSSNDTLAQFNIGFTSTNQIIIQAGIPTEVLRLRTNPVNTNTYNHLLVSVDMDTPGSSRVFINNRDPGVAEITFNQGSSIQFQTSRTFVGARTNGFGRFRGRISKVFLDTIYRDFNQASNRNLFNVVTTTGGLSPTPDATLEGMAPLIYLPTEDLSTATINRGTGGNFSQFGSPGNSSRTPAQYSNQLLEIPSNSNILIRRTAALTTDPTVRTELTFSLDFQAHTSAQLGAFNIVQSSTSQFVFSFNNGTGQLQVFNAAGTLVLSVQPPSGSILGGNHYQYTMSADLTDPNNRHLFLDGVDITADATWSTYSSQGYRLDVGNNIRIGRDNNNSPQAFTGGSIYFDDNYIDMSSGNPFWNSDENRPAFLGLTAERPSGSQPMVFLPLNIRPLPGLNLGSTSNFAANSSAFSLTTARRSNTEYWVHTGNFRNSTARLNTTSVTGASNTRAMTIAGFVRFESLGVASGIVTLGRSSSPNDNLTLSYLGNELFLRHTNTGGSTILQADFNFPTVNTEQWVGFFISFDTTNISRRHAVSYLSGNFADNSVWSVPTNHTIPTGLWDQAGIATNVLGQANIFRGDIGYIYVSNEYIDLSQDANRRLFVDRLGYPVDLQPHINRGILGDPTLYMRFDDPTNFGVNSGSYPDLGVLGTVTQGPDITLADLS